MSINKIIIRKEFEKELSYKDISESLYDSIKGHLKNNDDLEIDFEGAPINIIAILNDSIGKLLLEQTNIDAKNEIVDKITFSHIEDQGLLNNIIEMIENILEEKAIITED
ncbi:MAG: hypothetical protein WBG30_07620 [Psychrilyobacter sp.]|uniref:hypothetical protein n=1 Tax=Psychrilyobacter sp. TaxID=2586924 RepID=UPI003C754BAD